MSRKQSYEERQREKLFLKQDFEENVQKRKQQKIEINHRERKLDLIKMTKQIEDNYKSIQENLLENEGLDVKEEMLKERRMFIIRRFEEKEGKELPSNIKQFYEQDKSDEEKDDKQKNGKKPAKKAPKSKKLTEEEIFLKERDQMGPENSLELQNLKRLILQYSEEWAE
jgi:hypothetical protein